jgi:hypothetical protein
MDYNLLPFIYSCVGNDYIINFRFDTGYICITDVIQLDYVHLFTNDKMITNDEATIELDMSNGQCTNKYVMSLLFRNIKVDILGLIFEFSLAGNSNLSASLYYYYPYLNSASL